MVQIALAEELQVFRLDMAFCSGKPLLRWGG
jgi:hypothetical protein